MDRDPLFWNKVAGAVLGAGLLAMTAGFIANLIYHPTFPEQHAFVIEVPDAPAGPREEAPVGPEPIEGLLASASLESGEQLFRRCVACHTIEEGAPNRVGPNLWSVVGREKAAVAGYAYSQALQSQDGTWSYDSLNQFLFDPRAYAPGNKMNFAGLRRAQDRADVVLFMRSKSSEPYPLPE